MADVKTLEIVHPGPLATIQDQGRFGFGQYGVPASGALDSFSLRVGNLLAGNPEMEACLEITLMGLVVRALEDLTIAVTGADLTPRINGNAVTMWQSRLMKKGEHLSFKGPKSGCRAYLAIGGGINVPVVMGSRSTNLSARFGGLEGRPLRKGDLLASVSPSLHHRAAGKVLPPEFVPTYSSDGVIRVILGPQDHHFPPSSVDAFLGTPFKVTKHADRTGIRLTGPDVVAKTDLKGSILSEGVVPGAIQIPGDGQPIIILNETVTGGYRKIATVVFADLQMLGQLKPGDTVRFAGVSAEKAHEAFRNMEDIIAGLKN